MEDIKVAKNRIRTAMKSSLREVSPEVAQSASMSVLAQLENVEQWNKADVVLAFLSMQDELDTVPILRRVLEKGKILAVPRVVGSNLVFCQISDLENDVAPGAFGILEPVPGRPVVDCKPGIGTHIVALVPGLAFDKENFRLGRGKGFYDRFLALVGDSLYKIGIGYRFQLVEKVPVQLHDCKMDRVILSVVHSPVDAPL